MAGPTAAETGPLQLIDACIVLPPQTACTPIPAALPFHWDRDHADRDGQARFAFRFAVNGGGPAERALALLLPRAGNGFEVQLNGETLVALGQQGGQRTDTVKRPWLVPLPTELLRADNRLVVTVHATAGRAAQLHAPGVGPAVQMQEAHARVQFWRVDLTRLLMWTATLLGAMSLLVWVVQREPLFLACGIAELLWGLRLGEMFWVEMPLPWQAWGAGVATLFALTQLAMAYFFLNAVGRWSPGFRRAYLVYAALWAVVVPVIVLARWRDLWVGWIAANTAMFLALAVYVGWLSFRERHFWRWLFAAWVLASVSGGIADVLESPGSMYMHPTWSRVVMAGFSLAMAALVARRLQRARDAQQAQATQMAQALERQEAELRRALAERNRSEIERAMLEERARVMRDMHDGLGAELHGLLSLAEREDSPRSDIQRAVRRSIEELRGVVDAMTPFHGSLSTMLGDLRPQLEQRLALARIELAWAVDELPPVAGFDTTRVQHLRRLLLEASTNIARHSGARAATLSARLRDDGRALELRLADDGCGFDPTGPHTGNGVRNMHWRAASIGASLAFLVAGGTTLLLSIPLAAEASA